MFGCHKSYCRVFKLGAMTYLPLLWFTSASAEIEEKQSSSKLLWPTFLLFCFLINFNCWFRNRQEMVAVTKLGCLFLPQIPFGTRVTSGWLLAISYTSRVDRLDFKSIFRPRDPAFCHSSFGNLFMLIFFL